MSNGRGQLSLSLDFITDLNLLLLNLHHLKLCHVRGCSPVPYNFSLVKDVRLLEVDIVSYGSLGSKVDCVSRVLPNKHTKTRSVTLRTDLPTGLKNASLIFEGINAKLNGDEKRDCSSMG